MLVKKVTLVIMTVIGFIVAVAVVAHSLPKTERHFVLQEEAEVLLIDRIHQLHLMRVVNQHNLAPTLELDKHHLKWVEGHQHITGRLVVVDLKEMEQMDLIMGKEVIHS